MTFLSRISDWRATWCVGLLRRHTGRGRILRRVPYSEFFPSSFAEGAFSQAFVPVLAGYRNRTPGHQMREFVAVMGGNFIVVMTAMSLLGVVCAPLFVIIFAPGFRDDPTRLG
jgi:putative peptidoglycan lipid II flippase